MPYVEWLFLRCFCCLSPLFVERLDLLLHQTSLTDAAVAAADVDGGIDNGADDDAGNDNIDGGADDDAFDGGVWCWK